MLQFIYFYNIKLFKILKLCKIIDFRKKNKRKNDNEKNNKQIIEIHNYDLFNIN